MLPSLTHRLARRLTPRPARALLTLAFLLLAFASLAAGPAGAQQLAASFSTEPPASVASQAPFSVVVHVTDGTNPVTGAAVALTLAAGTGTLSGATSGSTDNNGDVTLAPSVDLAGAKQLTATASSGSFTSGSVTSNTFNVTPGPASQFVFTQQPTGTAAGLPLNEFTSPKGVIVQAQDAAGNVVVGQAITLSLGAGSAGTLTGTTTLTSDPNTGLAVFRGLRVTAPGTDTLVASVGDASSSSSTFTITADPAPVVTTTADDGSPGTLRSVLGFSAPGTVVTFDPAVFPPNSGQFIQLTDGEIDLSQDVTLTGPAGGVFISGNNQSRVFGVTAGAVSLSNLTIESGLTPSNEGQPFFGNGGGIAIGGGAVTLTDCSLVGNRTNSSNNEFGGNSGGGVSVSPSGALTMVGCTIINNSTGNGFFFFGGGRGGGISNAGSLIVTSCSFQSNFAGQGGGVYNSGMAVLTDDILYNDFPSEVFNDNALLSATYCDIQGTSGSAAQPDGNHNFSAEPQFNGQDLRVGPFGNNFSGSPVLGKGTTNAPGFRATDKDGNAYFSVPALGAYEAADEISISHVLWRNPNGRTIVWDLNTAGAYRIAGNYDPQSVGGVQYTAIALATADNGFNPGGAGPVGPTYVLWTAADGHAMLWSVAPNGARTVTPYTYGPFSDDGTAATTWQAVSVSADGSGGVHLLWSNPNGRTILWDVNPSDGSFTVRGNYDGFSDDGTAGTVWKAQALASGPDNLTHVLWSNADKRTLLWNLDASDDAPVASPPQGNTSTAYSYGTFSDDGTANTIWVSQALSVGPNSLPHILWTNPNGRTILWDVNSDGTFTIPANYAPVSDGTSLFTAVSLATDGAGRSHLAWDNADGSTLFWDVNPDGSHADFFFVPFLDDGTAATAWKAVAVSAGVSQNFD